MPPQATTDSDGHVQFSATVSSSFRIVGFFPSLLRFTVLSPVLSSMGTRRSAPCPGEAPDQEKMRQDVVPHTLGEKEKGTVLRRPGNDPRFGGCLQLTAVEPRSQR